MFNEIVAGCTVELIKIATATLYNNVKRLAQLGNAFEKSHSPSLDDAVTLSLRDMERVFTSYAGILTPSLKDFIVALGQSENPRPNARNAAP